MVTSEPHWAWHPPDGAAQGLTSDADGALRFGGVSTDSRTAREGDLFVALEGDNFDGHDYVIAALERGARAAVVSRDVEVGDNPRLYPVDDTVHALGRLAGYRRTHLRAALVGITGSSGKTGTKDLTRAALEGSRRLHATRGNLNNRVGLPLTLLDAPGRCRGGGPGDGHQRARGDPHPHRDRGTRDRRRHHRLGNAHREAGVSEGRAHGEARPAPRAPGGREGGGG